MDKYEMLRGVSRTFALSIEQLPGVLRDSITIAYLLLRVSDCLEDHDMIPYKIKPKLLRMWVDVLDGNEKVNIFTERIAYLDGSDPEAYVAQNADYVLRSLNMLPPEIQGIILKRVRQTSLGMARWQEHGPFVNTEEEMDDYMHQVAGLVGYLITEVFALHSPIIRAQKEQLIPLSREYGLALQTVNIIRGMRKDYERGWVYVPKAIYERFGLTRENLFSPENHEKALQVVNALAEKAERHLKSGLKYIMAFPFYEHKIRLSCMWPLFFAMATLAVSRNNARVLLDEVKISRGMVKKIITDTTLLGWLNPWLYQYYKYLSIPHPS